MKAMKAAAVLAGSLAVAGSAAPAFAAAPASAGPLAGLDEIVSEGLDHATPVGTNMLDAEHNESTVNAVKGVTKGLTSGGGPGKLLGGLPAGK